MAALFLKAAGNDKSCEGNWFARRHFTLWTAVFFLIDIFNLQSSTRILMSSSPQESGTHSPI